MKKRVDVVEEVITELCSVLEHELDQGSYNGWEILTSVRYTDTKIKEFVIRVGRRKVKITGVKIT